MPPKRRTSAPKSPPAEEPTAARNSESELFVGQGNNEHDESEETTSYVLFYNTTFSAHRVSPLYLGNEPLTEGRLRILSQRLRDRLVGDVVRGVEVRLISDGEGSVLARAGSLEKVEMEWVSVASVLALSRSNLEALSKGGNVENLREKKALHITLRYELAFCTALLLPSFGRGAEKRPEAEKTKFTIGVNSGEDEMDWEPTDGQTQFLDLPLMLMRMPPPLKAVVADFLATTFDCRVSPMRLGTRSLIGSWESWIQSAGVPTEGPLAKDMVLTLGFHVPTPESDSKEDSEDHTLGLKTIDIIIPGTELSKFVSAGQHLSSQPQPPLTDWGWESDLKKRRELAGRLYEEGWGWRADKKQPFTEALGAYMSEHLAVNLFHPGVRVVKIACGGFSMSESRLKVFAPVDSQDGESGVAKHKSAVLELLGALVEKSRVLMLGG
jgi:hypothetical protein